MNVSLVDRVCLLGQDGFAGNIALSQVNIPIPDDAMAALNLSPVEAAEEFRFAAAAKLYELGRLSSGAAASLAGVPRTVFLNRLSEYGVSTFQLDEEELKQDLSSA
jgi:predicted HTH domain antitoxin